VRALCDTGASLSVLSGDIFRRIRKSSYTVKPKAKNNKLLAADSTPMPVIAEIIADVKKAGLAFRAHFRWSKIWDLKQYSESIFSNSAGGRRHRK
jgi:hypothetical protein